MTKILLDRNIAPSKKFDWNDLEEPWTVFWINQNDKIDYDGDFEEYKCQKKASGLLNIDRHEILEFKSPHQKMKEKVENQACTK